MYSIKVNWKTTLGGIGVILTAVGVALNAAFDGDPTTVVQVEPLVVEVMVGLALIFARDGDKSSQDSGVRP